MFNVQLNTLQVILGAGFYGSNDPNHQCQNTEGSAISIDSATFAQLVADSLYFAVGHPFPLQISPLHGGSGPRLIMVLWAHPSPQPKRHLDRFSPFCRGHDCDTLTDRPRYSVCNNRMHLHSTVMWLSKWNGGRWLANVHVRRPVQTTVHIVNCIYG